MILIYILYKWFPIIHYGKLAFSLTRKFLLTKYSYGLGIGNVGTNTCYLIPWRIVDIETNSNTQERQYIYLLYTCVQK